MKSTSNGQWDALGLFKFCSKIGEEEDSEFLNRIFLNKNYIILFMYNTFILFYNISICSLT